MTSALGRLAVLVEDQLNAASPGEWAAHGPWVHVKGGSDLGSLGDFDNPSDADLVVLLHGVGAALPGIIRQVDEAHTECKDALNVHGETTCWCCYEPWPCSSVRGWLDVAAGMGISDE